MIEFYYWPTPNGHKSTMFLEEVELEYTIHPVYISAGDQFEPDFLRISDYAVFGGFHWARATSRFKLLEPDDPVAGWRERMFDLFGGFARKSVGYPI